MNKTEFVQTGGFPVKAERLQELQTAYEIFNQFGSLAGNLTIVSGCTVIGSNVSDGFVFINNELLPFKAGTLAANVIIVEEASSKEFLNGEVKPVHFNRYATFGTSVNSFPWVDFVRPIQTKTIPLDLVSRLENLEKKAAVFQAGGGMVFWNKPLAEIPDGWQEVVNWRGRIPVGLDTTQTEFNLMGKQGGAKNKTLSISEIPSHNHGLSQVKNYTSNFGTNGFYDRSNGAGNGTLTTDSQGGGASFSIMNPYRVVLFIEFIG
jgi:hypothetical protein